MCINWKKGFNRVFVVAAFGWSVYVMWYLPGQRWHERFDLESDRWSACLSAATIAHDKAKLEQCNAEHDRAFRDTPHTAWTGLGWSGWLFLIGVASIPPLILYWLLRGVGWIFNWIWRGFTSNVGTH